MMIGFIILSHSAPGQLLRLTQRLVQLFPESPIVCHHDFGQCALEVGLFPPNVEFVRPHLPTRWADISLTEAVLAALRQLYGRAAGGPDWFYVLSGTDYPLTIAAKMYADLAATNADAWIEGYPIEARGRSMPDEDRRNGFGRPVYRAVAYNRYIARLLRVPSPDRLWPPRRWRVLTLRRPIWNVLPTVYHQDFECFAGSSWFSGNRRAAAILIEPTPLHRRLMRHLRERFIPDETYFHTVLFNAAQIRIDRNPRRYIDWRREDGATDHPVHPRWLGPVDVPAALASGAHFGRKFPPSSPALDLIDQALSLVQH